MKRLADLRLAVHKILTTAQITATVAVMVQRVTQLTAAVIVVTIAGQERVQADRGLLVVPVHMMFIVERETMPLEILQASTAQRVMELHRA
jgi:hypothetical protein